MKLCSTCGKQLRDAAKFCDGCGREQPSSDVTQVGSKKTLHCPECKSNRFVPIVESTNTGGYATHTRLSRRVGVTSYSSNTIHREYWMCQSCGTKFRNLQNLKAELSSMEKNAKGCMTWAVVFAVAALFFFLFAPSILNLFGIFPMFVALVLLVLGLIYRSNAKRLTAEKAYLEHNCFS